MKLSGPLMSHVSGDNPTHASLKGLPGRLRVTDSALHATLQRGGYLTATGKPTTRAMEDGLLDTCENKLLWRVSQVRSALSPKKITTTRPQRPVAPQESRPNPNEPKWVDLETIGSYFGASKVQVGKWLDQLGMRALPEVEKKEDGSSDMLDVARHEQQRQQAGFIAKGPTEKALQTGVAKILTVTGRKNKVYDIPKWNLELVKELLVQAGHPLDTERKGMLKGKGKNKDVVVKSGGMDKRAQELYVQWARLYADKKTRWQCAKLFRGQPKAMLLLVEEKMNMPGYLVDGRYLEDK